MSEIGDPAKLKVVELRAELAQRGLDTKGNKAVLVDRLREALEEESGEKVEETSIAETSTEEGGNVSVDEQTRPVRGTKTSADADGNRVDYDRPGAAADAGAQESVRQEDQNRTDGSKIKIEEEKQVCPVEETRPNSQPVKVEPEEVKKEKGETGENFGENQKVTEGMGRTVKEESQDRDDSRGEKRKLSQSPSRRSPQRNDDEPLYDETAVLLSWYDSDLHLVVDKENFTTATPMHEHGYGYLWAGARATFGFSSGRVFFEVKLLENCDVSHLEDEPNPHVLRVGWSCVLQSLQLGEDPKSYGYGGTGKASTDCKFKDYGSPFLVGDVVGAFLDLRSNPIIMSFTVNGRPQGIAYEISPSQLEGEALFPHVLTKNIKFECNFGGQAPWFPPLKDYTFVGEVPLDQCVPGPMRPEKRSDCEMIMMCGLPGCGKTTWANEWRDKHPEKYYNILGTNNLIDKMKVMGLPRKRNYAGRWDVLIDRCMKGLNKLLEIAAHRRRNYILDQTNVYPSAQRRKMRGFEGFVRRAVVVVPTDEDFKRRIEKREKEEGKDVPESAVLEMKANFVLPVVGDVFSSVEFTELGEAEARALVLQYNEEGRKAGYGQQHKRPRLDKERGGSNAGFRGGSGGGFRQRGGGGAGGGGSGNISGGRPDMKPRGGSSGGWQPRGGGGNRWDSRPQQASSGFRRGGSAGGSSGGSSGGWRGGSGSPSGPPGGRGNWDTYGSRGYDNRSRPSGGSGNHRPNVGSKGWGSGYNQGGGSGGWGNANNGSGGGGGGGSSGSGSGTGTGSGGWNQQSYNQQSGWGGQQSYSQQGGWKGYGQQSSYGQGGGGGGGGGGGVVVGVGGGGGSSSSSGGGSAGGGYGQQSYSQQSYGNGNGYQNWNQQYYNQGGYQGSSQGWGQAGSDNSYANYQQSQQQGSWQGYGQNYGYGSGGSGPHMAQGGYGK